MCYRRLCVGFMVLGASCTFDDVRAAQTDAGGDAATCTPRCEGTTLFTCEGEEPARVECALGCQAGTSPRCARPVLSNGADITDLAGVPDVAFVVPRDRTYSIDTSSGRIVDDSGSVVRPTTGNGGVDDVTGSYFGFDDNGQALLAVHSLTVESGATLRGTGNRALIVLSRGAILVQGVVDVSGGCVGEDSSSRCGGPGGGDGGTVERGAGGCAPGGPGVGTPGGGLEQSESGGGGGGFGQAGAPGGLTGSEVTPRVGGVPGRPSAACSGATLTPLAGGSGGGAGGVGDVNGGVGGGGGGAIQLSSLQRIEIDARAASPGPAQIRASGAGGAAPAQRAQGGGGGGSGGGVLLEAPVVVVAARSIVVANGGGGGSGLHVASVAGAHGAPGSTSSMQAAGGIAEDDKGAGGLGGARDGDATQGQWSFDGSGGGGGGVGIIRINARTLTLAVDAVISPAHSEGTLVIE
jgi:hypothetical protein